MYSSTARQIEAFPWNFDVTEAVKNISENLRWWLEDTGRKQTWVAEKLGVTRSTVSMWVTGNAPPRFEHLAALANLIGVPLVVLLIEDGLKDPKAALTDLAKKI